MDQALSLVGLGGFAAAALVTLLSAIVKGAVGFAMPMLMISGLASFLDPRVALAALILPTLAANLQQSFRQGIKPAIEATAPLWRYVMVLLIVLVIVAQLIYAFPAAVLIFGLGAAIVVLAALQLAGWRPAIPPHARNRTDVIAGALSGVMGGLSGVWGPVTVLYLAALNTPKSEAIKIQGVMYSAGAVVLTLAHLRSGILNAATIPLSAFLVLPTLIGVWAGFQIQDRLDQARFRRWTLIVLVFAGLNLMRRGLLGL
ncbi:MAG: sulfite exporter TauE/SafE family protein [Pseudomonadota bacterium]